MLVEANKLLTKAQQMESVIILHAHGRSEELAVGGWTDAGWANRVDESSTGGFMLCLAPVRILDGAEVDTTMIYWASQRLRRVCRSSLACEVQGLANCDQELFFARLACAEIGLGRRLKISDPLSDVRQVPGFIAIDAKCTYDAMCGASGPLELCEKRTAIEMVSVQQSLNSEQVVMRWVHLKANLTNSLTKPTAEDPLRTFMSGRQRWRLVKDDLMRSSKNRRKAGLQRLEQASFAYFDSNGRNLSRPWDAAWPRLPITMAAEAENADDDAEVEICDSFRLRDSIFEELISQLL